MAEPDGRQRLAVVAQQPAEAATYGVTLENLHLQVHAPQRLAWAASGPSLAALAEGRARLRFDVLLGEPILPDPYAANWLLPDRAGATAAALSLTLRWEEGGAPGVRAQLDRAIGFPAAPDAGDRGDRQLDGEFIEHVGGRFDALSLLDLSTRAHHFGIALEPLDAQQPPAIDADNRLAVPLRTVRLMMQPQVHWEPVDDVLGRLVSGTHGGATLIGAKAITQVAALPGAVEAEIVAAAGRTSPAAALFSLPFGMRALAFADPVAVPQFQVPAVTVDRRRPAFDSGIAGAAQLRLTATGGIARAEARAPDRTMPGKLHQTDNLVGGPLPNVLTPEIAAIFAATFPAGVPLHAVDLSGYGLSCFSNWHVDPAGDAAALGITQVRFDVLVGRTAYEVVQARSVLVPCMARVVRTIMLERRSSGRVKRFDSGWQAIDDGEYRRYVAFEKGVVNGLRRIRNIRNLPVARLVVGTTTWQAVRFDADADIQDAGGGGRVAAIDQDGYVQITASPANSPPDAARLAALFQAVGGPIGGAIDCRARLGGTLDAQLLGLRADFAPDDANARKFAVAVYGAPTLARVGQWAPVRIDGATAELVPIDPQRGVPVVRRTLAGRPGARLAFCDPADANRTKPAAPYALLFATASSRVLFPEPSIVPGAAGAIDSAPPLIADPVALVQAGGSFPRAAFALRAKEQPLFAISDADDWRLTNPIFSFDTPKPDLASGAGWSIARNFLPGPQSLDLTIDSGAPLTPWQLVQPEHEIVLSIPGLGPILTIRADFAAIAGKLPGMRDPVVALGDKLNDLKQMVTALGEFSDLGFDVDVDVAAGQGPSPSFVVHLHLAFQIGSPDGRIDIGIGKFYGRFDLDGMFEAALDGQDRATLKLLFQGDVQQGILPPLLYAGGLFRFGIEVGDSGDPVIEMGLGTVISLGGDLIKGLIAVEATIHYGYTLVPKTLQPGVLLGIEARAKLLGGLLGLSFSAEAMARAERLNSEDKTVRIFAQIRVAGSVHVAWLFEKSVDFETHFEQNIPLAPLLIVGGINPLVAVAASAVI